MTREASVRPLTQNPSKYVPAFGGYCGYSAARNVLKPVTASVGSIIGGRLILMHDEKTYDIWKQDIKGVLAKADANWPALLSRHGAPLEPYVLVNKNESGIALQGYDPVAYYTLKRATPGDPQYTTAFEDAIYQFVSAEHRDTFIKNPHRYAPMFGGYCGTALSMNMLVEVCLCMCMCMSLCVCVCFAFFELLLTSVCGWLGGFFFFEECLSCMVYGLSPSCVTHKCTAAPWYNMQRLCL